MKENFPNPAKKIDFQEVQEDQRVPKKLDPSRDGFCAVCLFSFIVDAFY